MAREVLPGEKKICQLVLRVEETERERLLELADSRGVDSSIVHREALRQYLDLEGPTNERFNPTRGRR